MDVTIEMARVLKIARNDKGFLLSFSNGKQKQFSKKPPLEEEEVITMVIETVRKKKAITVIKGRIIN